MVELNYRIRAYQTRALDHLANSAHTNKNILAKTKAVTIHKIGTASAIIKAKIVKTDPIISPRVFIKDSRRSGYSRAKNNTAKNTKIAIKVIMPTIFPLFNGATGNRTQTFAVQKRCNPFLL